MAYRDDVEALRARYAAAEAELALRIRERDEVKRLLDEALRHGLPSSEDPIAARRQRRVRRAALVVVTAVAASALYGLVRPPDTPGAAAVARPRQRTVVDAPSPRAMQHCANAQRIHADDAIAVWTAEHNLLDVDERNRVYHITCDLAREHHGNHHGVDIVHHWLDAGSGRRTHFSPPGRPTGFDRVNSTFGFPDDHTSLGRGPGYGSIVVPDALDLRIVGAMTIEAWIHPGQPRGWEPPELTPAQSRRGDVPLTIVSKWESFHSDQHAYLFAIDPRGHLDFRVSADGTTRGFSVTTRAPVAFDAWSHVAATYDGGALRIFVNGQLQGTAPGPRWIYPGDAPLAVGTTYYSQQFFVGEMDDIALYARALSADELRRHAAGPNPGARQGDAAR